MLWMCTALVPVERLTLTFSFRRKGVLIAGHMGPTLYIPYRPSLTGREKNGAPAMDAHRGKNTR
jgi:hypothetical protein